MLLHAQDYYFVWVMCNLSEQMIKEIKGGTTRVVILNWEGKGHFILPENVTKSGDIFGCHNGRDIYWHLLCRWQRYYETCYNAQNCLTTKNYLPQNVNSAKVKKPCSRAKSNQMFDSLAHLYFQAIHYQL